MSMKEMELREQICDVCHKMWQLGWVAANDGNVSARLSDNVYLATPTGISKSFITPEKLVVIDGDGNILRRRKAIALLPKSRCTFAAIRSARTWAAFCMRILR